MSKELERTDVAVPSVPWNPLLGVIFILLVFFMSEFIGGFIVDLYPLLHHWDAARANSWLTNSVYAQFVYILIAESFTLGAIFGFLRYHKVSISTIGLKQFRWQDPLYGLIAAPFYYVLYALTVGVVTQLTTKLNVNQTQNIGFTSVHGVAQLIFTAISLVILPPITEEIMVRGMLYSSLKKYFPTVAAVLITSAIFGAAHLPEGGAGGLLWIGALDTFVLSVVLIFLREKTKSLYASMTLHAIKNGLAYFVLFIVPLLRLRW